MHQLRDSGQIENDADVVAIIRPMPDQDEFDEIIQAEVIVKKSRNNRTGKVLMQFRRDITRFFSAAILPEDAPPAKTETTESRPYNPPKLRYEPSADGRGEP